MKQLPEDIRAWIADPNRSFWDGLSILSVCTANKTLIRNLSKKENKYSKEKLLGEIKKLSANLPLTITTPIQIDANDPGGKIDDSQGQLPDLNDDAKDPPPAGRPGGVVTNPPGTETVQPNADDAKAVEELQMSLSKMFNLKGMLSNSMRDLSEDDNVGRKEIMDRIQSINGSMTEIETKIKHFETTGSLPLIAPVVPPANEPTQPEIPQDKFLATRKMQNLRSSISKLKGKIAEGHADPEVIKRLEEEMQSKIDLVDRIKKYIDGADGI